jgi:hypothetical protein
MTHRKTYPFTHNFEVGTTVLFGNFILSGALNPTLVNAKGFDSISRETTGVYALTGSKYPTETPHYVGLQLEGSNINALGMSLKVVKADLRNGIIKFNLISGSANTLVDVTQPVGANAFVTGSVFVVAKNSATR